MYIFVQIKRNVTNRQLIGCLYVGRIDDFTLWLVSEKEENDITAMQLICATLTLQV